MHTARADRIEQLIRERISKGQKINKDFLKQIQLDTVDSYCIETIKSIEEKLGNNNK